MGSLDNLDDMPPSYDVSVSGPYVDSSTSTRDDGRIDVIFQEKNPGLEEILLATQTADLEAPPKVPLEAVSPLNIVIQIVGSRGDVQPFIALGTHLKISGHRIRIATHATFESFVRNAGLEFFAIGGNPEELMSFMVKNPGVIPKMSTITGGEIGRKRQMIAEILDGCWRSCIEPDQSTQVPFVANAIIANPPSFAHIHLAQALGVPLHIMFTMPWTPTREFPHPLANVVGSGGQPSAKNIMSYSMVEMLTWSGLADLINKWRVETLNLQQLSMRTAVGMMEAMKVPHTYCWSPALIKKPLDWPWYIDVCGFFFRDEPLYSPSPDIAEFLNNGKKPVYIGFGSIVMDDPARMTSVIQEACQNLGVRAIVSRGWSRLGQNCQSPDILFIDDCPHEWLFKQVAAVVHHGGAGTTACGLLNSCPTAIVPFFGDQPFWASMVAAAGAGPPPLDKNKLTAQSLAEAIGFCLTPNAQAAASSIAALMRVEEGVQNAAASFHQSVPWVDMKCDLLPSETAVWLFEKRGIKISHKALTILSQLDRIDMQQIKIHRSKELPLEKTWTDPLTSTSGALINTVTSFSKGLGRLPTDPVKGMTQMTSSLVKGSLVEAPIALTEGLRNIPRIYGKKPEDLQPINGWKSGFAQAGKGFYTGFADGLTGFVKKPYQEARRDGAVGFMKGFAQGSVELFSKPGAAMFGLMAYPAMGIHATLRKRRLSPIEAKILEAQIAIGAHQVRFNPPTPSEIQTVRSKFDAMK